jgi:CitB family two-component system response regulator MalR
LIVEDDPMVAELNSCYLGKIPGVFLVGIAGNSSEALGYLQKEEIDLLLLDVYIPGQNGFELLNKIREEQYSVDVIMITAARDKSSIECGLRLGIVDYLVKPFDFERFQLAVVTYKKRKELLKKQTKISQHEIDSYLICKGDEITTVDVLPKGVVVETLKSIWANIEQINGEFTAEELSKTVGISLVSMRKYLKFLVQKSMLKSELNYGAIGRPGYRYQRSNVNGNLDLGRIIAQSK